MASKYSEKHSRSIAKAVTFRVIIILSDGIIVYAVTRKVDLALTVIIVRNVVAMFLYYFHERIWNGIHWGKGKKT
jgi:adenylylsulfate kinase